MGAQTEVLARDSSGAAFTSIDISAESLEKARARVDRKGLSNVTFAKDNILATSFPDASFDHVFVCFVLEHLDQPLRALAEMKRVLRPGGTFFYTWFKTVAVNP